MLFIHNLKKRTNYKFDKSPHTYLHYEYKLALLKCKRETFSKYPTAILTSPCKPVNLLKTKETRAFSEKRINVKLKNIAFQNNAYQIKKKKKNSRVFSIEVQHTPGLK